MPLLRPQIPANQAKFRDAVRLSVPSPEADGQMESQNFAPQRHQITANSSIQSALEAVLIEG
jgi:hypothetical protein